MRSDKSVGSVSAEAREVRHYYLHTEVGVILVHISDTARRRYAPICYARREVAYLAKAPPLDELNR